MNDRVRNMFNNLKYVMLNILSENNSNYIVLQTATLFNHILELCKAVYIETYNNDYIDPLCRYKEHCIREYDIQAQAVISRQTGNTAPKLVDTVMISLHNENVLSLCNDITNFYDKVTETRNDCVHNIEKLFGKVKTSIEFMSANVNMLDSFLMNVSLSHNVKYIEGLLGCICLYASCHINNSMLLDKSVLSRELVDINIETDIDELLAYAFKDITKFLNEIDDF